MIYLWGPKRKVPCTLSDSEGNQLRSSFYWEFIYRGLSNELPSPFSYEMYARGNLVIDKIPIKRRHWEHIRTALELAGLIVRSQGRAVRILFNGPCYPVVTGEVHPAWLHDPEQARFWLCPGSPFLDSLTETDRSCIEKLLAGELTEDSRLDGSFDYLKVDVPKPGLGQRRLYQSNGLSLLRGANILDVARQSALLSSKNGLPRQHIQHAQLVTGQPPLDIGDSISDQPDDQTCGNGQKNADERDSDQLQKGLHREG